LTVNLQSLQLAEVNWYCRLCATKNKN